MSGSPVTGAAPREEFGGRRAALVVAVSQYVDPSLGAGCGRRLPLGGRCGILLADPEIGGFARDIGLR